MNTSGTIPGWKDKILFTPGPLTTSRTVKQAMLQDVGSWDYELRAVVKEIRLKLPEIAATNPSDYTTILMQGSGSFGLEAVIGSTVPRDGKLLAITNGAYGDRIVTIASVLNIDTVVIKSAENKTPDLSKIKSVLEADPSITNVIVVHCETTTGIVNPIEKIGEIVKQYPAKYIVDAMSSFGAVEIDMTELGIDYLVSSPNKCIEGVPGFSFIIAKLSSFMETRGYARSLCLDILGQYDGF
jgi:2-aminoethylphosphonate-pyruvate transaminase